MVDGEYKIDDLKAIMAQLRNRDGGCPWDLKQDFKSIAKYTIEEAYEVVDAIERGHYEDLCEELGDLLFQVIYHAQMATEENRFEFDDVVNQICAKLIRRHPHVFGDETLKTDEAIAGMWERIKAQEKKERVGDQITPSSLLDNVPVGMTALTRAIKLQNKAAKVGFDWPTVGPVIEKIEEELLELKEVMGDAVAEPSIRAQKSRQVEEFGDLLFVMANLARHLKIDPESALRGANEKFCKRFAYIEQAFDHNRQALEKASLEEMDLLWDEAKTKE